MRSECCMCPPIGVRVILSNAALRKRRIVKIDVKSAFLQSGPDQPDVHVISPWESSYHNDLWLLLSAAYGLVSANAGWHMESDPALLSLWLKPIPQIAQLLGIGGSNHDIRLIVIKIVDDTLVTCTDAEIWSFAAEFGKRFPLRSISQGPGEFRFYGLNNLQKEDFTCSLDGDDKLFSLSPYPLSCVHRRQCDEGMKTIEKQAFMSIHSAIGWLCIIVSPLYAFSPSYLHGN